MRNISTCFKIWLSFQNTCLLVLCICCSLQSERPVPRFFMAGFVSSFGLKQISWGQGGIFLMESCHPPSHSLLHHPQVFCCHVPGALPIIRKSLVVYMLLASYVFLFPLSCTVMRQGLVYPIHFFISRAEKNSWQRVIASKYHFKLIKTFFGGYWCSKKRSHLLEIICHENGSAGSRIQEIALIGAYRVQVSFVPLMFLRTELRVYQVSSSTL